MCPYFCIPTFRPPSFPPSLPPFLPLSLPPFLLSYLTTFLPLFPPSLPRGVPRHKIGECHCLINTLSCWCIFVLLFADTTPLMVGLRTSLSSSQAETNLSDTNTTIILPNYYFGKYGYLRALKSNTIRAGYIKFQVSFANILSRGLQWVWISLSFLCIPGSLSLYKVNCWSFLIWLEDSSSSLSSTLDKDLLFHKW